MDKTTFYNIINIDSPDEFQYYENLAAILEEDDYIESNLLKDLLKDIDIEVVADCTENYFEEFLKAIPDEETELYITVEAIKRAFLDMMSESLNPDDAALLADEIVRFRKWYVQDNNAYDRIKKEDISVRDARYDIQAAKLLGDKVDIDFRNAYDYEVNGGGVRISEIIDD